MKNRKSRWAAIFMAFLCSVSPVNAFAGESENPTPVTITSGLNLEQETVEATFDSSRVVYGEAKPATQVSVALSQKNMDGILVEQYYEDLEVGALGIFSVTLPLEMGENYITLTAYQPGYDEVCYNVEVKRVSQWVKKELQNMVALPGLVKK